MKEKEKKDCKITKNKLKQDFLRLDNLKIFVIFRIMKKLARRGKALKKNKKNRGGAK
jgi:hypothetical protein